MFRDRTEAGKMLAQRLKQYEGEDGIVLAVPRGGVEVAYQVALELNLPMEVVLAKKLGHPNNKEYAIGAASMNDHFVVPHAGVTQTYIEQELHRVRRRLREMQIAYMGKIAPRDLKDKVVIVVDDGIATGNTLIGTIHLLKNKKPKKLVIAVPVAAAASIKKLQHEVDEVVAVLVPDDLYGVGMFYHNFRQLSDADVVQYLNNLKDNREAV